jgi:5-formyltetrahydrofolate cyclo-ligase
MAQDFADKSAARQWVWNRLAAEGVARFPFPPHGRIPNFAGAEVAAARLLDIEPWKSARAIKVNPDSPQRPLRAEALRRGITVFIPTPRLRGGFKKLDPRRIPPDKMDEAASLSHGDRWSEEVALAEMPEFDGIVCGSVAVTRDGGAVARAKATATWNSPFCASSVTRRCLSPRPYTICRSSPPCPATRPISRSV